MRQFPLALTCAIVCVLPLAGCIESNGLGEACQSGHRPGNIGHSQLSPGPFTLGERLACGPEWFDLQEFRFFFSTPAGDSFEVPVPADSGLRDYVAVATYDEGQAVRSVAWGVEHVADRHSLAFSVSGWGTGPNAKGIPAREIANTPLPSWSVSYDGLDDGVEKDALPEGVWMLTIFVDAGDEFASQAGYRVVDGGIDLIWSAGPRSMHVFDGPPRPLPG